MSTQRKQHLGAFRSLDGEADPEISLPAARPVQPPAFTTRYRIARAAAGRPLPITPADARRELFCAADRLTALAAAIECGDLERARRLQLALSSDVRRAIELRRVCSVAQPAAKAASLSSSSATVLASGRMSAAPKAQHHARSP